MSQPSYKSRSFHRLPTPESLGHELLSQIGKLPRRIDMAKVVLLIKDEADVNVMDGDGNTALILAAQHGKRDLVELLLASGAKINHQNDFGASALMMAAYEGHEDVAKLLIDKKANTQLYGSMGSTARSWAKEQGHEKIADMIDTAYAAEMRASVEAASAKPAEPVKPPPTKWPKGFKL